MGAESQSTAGSGKTNETLRSHAKETLELLSETGHLEEAAVKYFPLETHVSLGEQHRRGEGTTILRSERSDVSDRVQTSTQVDNGTLKLYVLLEDKRSYAIYDPNDQESEYLIAQEVRRYSEDGIVDISYEEGMVRPQASSTCLDETCEPNSCLREIERCLPIVGCYTTADCTCGC